MDEFFFWMTLALQTLGMLIILLILGITFFKLLDYLIDKFRMKFETHDNAVFKPKIGDSK